jgi:hypothetical protein
MKTTPQSMKDEFSTLFGELNAKQLWLLTKFAKYVRLRARNNSAFNNLSNQVFPYAHFRQVMKNRQDGTSYPGLEIITKIGGLAEEIISEESED